MVWDHQVLVLKGWKVRRSNYQLFLYSKMCRSTKFWVLNAWKSQRSHFQPFFLYKKVFQHQELVQKGMYARHQISKQNLVIKNQKMASIKQILHQLLVPKKWNFVVVIFALFLLRYNGFWTPKVGLMYTNLFLSKQNWFSNTKTWS